MRAAISRWQAEGLSVPTDSGRWLVLRSALSWAVAEELLRSNPLAGVRGPARPRPRRHHSLAEVRQLLGYAEQEVERASAFLVAEPASPRRLRSLFSAEQDLLLVRLAADSGARRGELAVLRLGDLDRRVLTIERGLSHGVLGSTKSSRARRVTLGATTVALIHHQFVSWAEPRPTPMGDWLFAPTPARETFMSADARTQLCTGSATASPPTWWRRASCSRLRPVSAIGTRPRPYGTTPMRFRSTTWTSPTNWTRY